MLTLAIQQLSDEEIAQWIDHPGIWRLRQSLHRCNDGDAIHHRRP